MKKLYFLVVLVMSFATQAQIVNIPDANFKNLLLSSSATTTANQIATGLTGGWIKIDANSDGEIQVSEALQVKTLIKNCQTCSVSQKVSFIDGIEYFSNLTNLQLTNHQITSIDIINTITTLETINFATNSLANFNIPNLTSLVSISLQNNYISSFNFPISDNLLSINLNNNQISNINLFNYKNLQTVDLKNNFLETLDLIGLKHLTSVQILNNPNLEHIFFINLVSDSPFPINFGIDSNVKYICVDEMDYSYALNAFNYVNGNPIVINSYCDPFFSGLGKNIVSGKVVFDFNTNGCDINDLEMSAIKIIATNILDSNIQYSFTSEDGTYDLFLEDGDYTIEPFLNGTYYTVSGNTILSLDTVNSAQVTNDFCVTFNGVHHDVEVVFISTIPARPGFDANYRMIYKNNGNQVENGIVTLDFNDAVLDLVSASPTFSNQTSNILVWNYTNLQPFETRIIDLVFNVNSPTETPSVNIGDQLNYTATITPLVTDEFQFDNTSALKQLVVGSYDPNDKKCVEGTTVGPDMIGQYVHYIIRFENTGTYAAQNVVVKDLIDLAKFDVSTLIPLHSSHDFVTRIAGNKVEFIFEGINLPFDDANNDGYVAFKIKTKSNLVVGDTFSNNANIYFDYNFPITTNTFTTTIAALKVTDFDFRTHFTLYPNPVKDVLNFQSKDNTTINSIEIYNTLGQVVLAIPNAISTVDVSNLQSGNYFVKVNTDLGVSNTKFIKE